MDLSLPQDWFYLILRLAFVGLIYLFLWSVARITLRDMMRAEQSVPARAHRGRPKLKLLEPAASGLEPGSSFRLGARTAVGRHPESSLVLDDPSISAVHARLELREDGWCVVELGSTNGTFVNGRRVSGPTYIEANDIVQFGRMTFQFEA